MCKNLRRNNNPTSWKRNVKISWNYHENNFTWGEIVASIDKKQINSYDLTKRVHACFSRDFFFVMTHDARNATWGFFDSRARLRKIWLELSVSFAGFSESFHSTNWWALRSTFLTFVLCMTGDCFEEEKTLFSAAVGIKLFPNDL